MNDEIKEILEDYSCIPRIKKLGDYITNLQQENESLKEDRDNILYLEEALQQENEYLKMNSPEQNMEHFRIIDENKRKIDNLREQNKKLKRILDEMGVNPNEVLDYKSRCEKAVERLREELSYYFDNCTDESVDDEWSDNASLINDLLNILQNGSDDNE